MLVRRGRTSLTMADIRAILVQLIFKTGALKGATLIQIICDINSGYMWGKPCRGRMSRRGCQGILKNSWSERRHKDASRSLR